MIRVTVEVVPGGTGHPTTLGTIIIANDLATSLETEGRRGSYRYRFIGRNARLLNRSGRVADWPRRSKPIWNLVHKVLTDAGYDK